MNDQSPQIQIIQQEEEEAKLCLKDYYAILRRRWPIVLMAFVIMLGLASTYLVRKPKEYTATALVRVSNSSAGGGRLASALGGFLSIGQSNSMATEIEMIRLRRVAEVVIKKLELDKKEQNLGLDWEQIVSRFQKELKAGQRGKSDLVGIAITGVSADGVRDIANAVAEEYVRISEASRQKLWSDLIEQMDTRLSQVKADLEKSRKLLHEHEAEAGISTAFSPILTGTGTPTGRSVSQYMIPEVPQAIVQLKMGIMQTEVELEALKQSFPDSDANVVKLERQLAASKKRLQQETEKAVDKYNKQFGLTGAAAAVLFSQELYSSLVAKQEELKAQHIMQNESSKMIQKAAKPRHPDKSNSELALMGGAVVGLFLGFGLALVQEYRDSSMHKSLDVRESIDVPVLGMIPRLGRANKRSRSNATPGKNVRIDYEDSSQKDWVKELHKESYRMLQLELMENVQNQDGLALLVTSSVSGEGKSTVAVNLAISIAQTGRKVLLVNADTHSSTHCELLDLDPQMGLIDVLLGNAQWDDVIKNTSLNNLYAVTAGEEDGQSDLSSLLISSRLVDFVESSREQFDVTIFDSSPAIATSESAAISSKVDGVALVIKMDETQADAILQAKQRIQNAGGNILGAVLNGAAIEKKYYMWTRRDL